jgi:hypothetical protein
VGKAGLADVTEVPVVVDCEYASFADYWASFTSGQGRFASTVMSLSDSVRAALEHHVRNGYLVGLPNGPRSFPMMFRMVRGVVPA